MQLELIVDSETGFASSTNILNLVDQLKGKKMRKKEAEQVLQKFVQSKWLIEVPWWPSLGSIQSVFCQLSQADLWALLYCKLSATYERRACVPDTHVVCPGCCSHKWKRLESIEGFSELWCRQASCGAVNENSPTGSCV